MRTRTWPTLAAAFGTLLLLIAVLGLATLRRSQQIYGDISSLDERYQRIQRSLSQLRTEIHLSGVLARDYLLDPSAAGAGDYRDQLRTLRSAMDAELDELMPLLGGEDAPRLRRLREELERYWNSLEPLWAESRAQKLASGAALLRRQVIPHRDAVLALAQELRDLNQASVQRQRVQIDEKQGELPVYLERMLPLTLIAGALMALGVMYRMNRLERGSEQERMRAERAERELRRLSQQLVQAHEDERRALSRELHDQVGQMLTALRVALRNAEELGTSPAEQAPHLKDAQQLSEEALRVVRDLAMGLRPSMLDDLGLAPALEWQAREFSRRFGVPVTVELDGALDRLSDAHRTCVFRVMQEALTNCARHARATGIRVTVEGRETSLRMSVRDDGVGFDASQSGGRGLGLIGIQERVRELDGKLELVSQPGQGTLLAVTIPVPREAGAP